MQESTTLTIDGHQVIVDIQDLHLFDGRAWRVRTYSARKKPYLKWQTTNRGDKRTVSFHRLIMRPTDSEVVDHINGNSLDNRRSNLRLVDWTKNAWNRANPCNAKSRFNGVGWSGGRWQVSIRDGKRQIYIGRFQSEIEAAYHYDLASLKYHGEFGRRNFLPLVTD